MPTAPARYLLLALVAAGREWPGGWARGRWPQVPPGGRGWRRHAVVGPGPGQGSNL